MKEQVSIKMMSKIKLFERGPIMKDIYFYIQILIWWTTLVIVIYVNFRLKECKLMEKRNMQEEE